MHIVMEAVMATLTAGVVTLMGTAMAILTVGVVTLPLTTVTKPRTQT